MPSWSCRELPRSPRVARVAVMREVWMVQQVERLSAELPGEVVLRLPLDGESGSLHLIYLTNAVLDWFGFIRR